MSFESFGTAPRKQEELKEEFTPEETARLKELAQKSRQSIRGAAEEKEEFLRLLAKAEKILGEERVQKVLEDSANEFLPEK